MLDLAIIVLYFICMIAVGFYVYRKRKASSSDGFFVANRSGTTLLILGSLCATFIGASAVVGMAGLGYSRGLSGAWWLLVGAIGLFVLGFFLARRVRRFGLYTLPELVEKQYDSRAGLATSILIVIAWIAVIAGQIVAAGKILSVILPYDQSLLMVTTAAIFVLYTVLGGQYSIIRTDVIQFGILIIGILVSLGLVLSRVGGIGGLTASLPSDYVSFPVSIGFGWYDLIVFLVLTGSTYVVGPDIYARLFCARDENVARSSALWAGVVAILVAFVIVLIGMGARVLFPAISSEQAFPMVIEHILPVGVTGLVMAALLAAIMSSADTTLLTTSTIVTQDVYKRLAPDMGERKTLLVSRVAVVVIGVLSVVVALELKGIISSLFLAYTVFTSGVVVPVIAGFYKDKLKVNSIGALSAIIGGGGTALVVRLLGVAYLELLGFAVCIVLLFGVSWMTGRNK